MIDELICYNSIDYFHDEGANDINQLVLAGAHKDPAGPPGMDTLKVVKMLNSKDIPIKELYGEDMNAIGKFTQVKYINYNQKIQGVIAATDKGSVQVLNNYNNFQFDEKFEFIAHYGAVTQMAVSPDNQHLFTAGQDGSLMIWDIGEYYL